MLWPRFVCRLSSCSIANRNQTEPLVRPDEQSRDRRTQCKQAESGDEEARPFEQETDCLTMSGRYRRRISHIESRISGKLLVTNLKGRRNQSHFVPPQRSYPTQGTNVQFGLKRFFRDGFLAIRHSGRA